MSGGGFGSAFESMYRADSQERAVFGNRYVGPRNLPHHEWVVAAKFPKASSDGHDAVVMVSASPARFYRVKGGGIDLSTGSGSEMGRLCVAIAGAISEGMLGHHRGD